ncbi:MAG: MATE family efflux transporter [Muribaculaceae bacterium]|nr:MATE family efflux transporter [Muribaculaceae bacterium]
MRISENKIDMLSGPIGGRMLMFALPLVASGILQQSFNSVDFAVAGRFAGPEALAAVGSNGPVIALLVNLFMGLSVGVNVVIANNIGQHNSDGVRKSTATAAMVALVCGLFMLLLTQLIAPHILRLLDTPAEVLDQAIVYLRIFGLSLPFLMIYNVGSAILRSVGDTRRPFYSLVISGLANVGFNLLFVVGMDMGVAGVAWGTFIASVINAALIVWWLTHEESDIRLDLANIRAYSSELQKIINIGLPAGIQGTVFAVSNVFVISAINSFGAAAVAGSAAAVTYEFYCYLVIAAFNQTVVAFVGQNYGAGNYERCRRIFRLGFTMAFCSTIVLNIIIGINGSYCMIPFTTDPDVIHYGMIRLSTALMFQFIAVYYEIAASAMRGLGVSMLPALITIFGTCLIRIPWVVWFPADGTFAQLLSVYPITWTVTTILMACAYIRTTRRLLSKREEDGQILCAE